MVIDYGSYGAHFEIKMFSYHRDITKGLKLKLTRLIQDEIQKSIKENFSTESAKERWAQLSPAYAKRKEELYGKRKILSASGELEMFVTSGKVTLAETGENIQVYYKMRIGKNKPKFLVPLTGAFVKQKRTQVAQKMYGWRGMGSWQKNKAKPSTGAMKIPPRPWNYLRPVNLERIEREWAGFIYEKILNGFDVEFNKGN